MRRRLVERLPDRPGTMELGSEHHRHLVRVLRMEVGDTLVLFDRQGHESIAQITSIGRNALTVSHDRPTLVDREPRCAITLAFALPKAHKPDLILQKCTELGVRRFMLFMGERSVVKPSSQKIAERLSRWASIIDAACGQSGRAITPAISFFEDISAMLREIDASLRLCLLPEASSKISQFADPLPDAVALLIGPEGGLTSKELSLVKEHGFNFVTFGRRILRAETAAIAAVVPFALD